MDELKKVQAEEPVHLKAGTWNAFIDAARAMRGRSSDRSVQPGYQDTMPGVVLVRNDTGAGISDLGVVLGLDTTLVFTADGKLRTPVIFKGILPDKAKHRGKFCVLTGPVGIGKFVEAYVDAVATVRLLVPNEEGADKAPFAEIDHGEKRLRCAGYGSAQILHRENTGYGEMWAVVRLGRAPSIFPVKLTQAGGAQGTSTSAATWTYNVLDPYTDEALTTSPVSPVSGPHKWKRPSVGQMIVATHGLARFDQDGLIVLTWINETPDSEPC